jgi:hypothetical protein
MSASGMLPLADEVQCVCMCLRSNNSLSSLPSNLFSTLIAGQINSVLDLQANNFSSIASLVPLSTISALDLSYNPLGRTIPDFSGLHQLTTLLLRSCAFTSVPTGASWLPSGLKSLDISLNPLQSVGALVSTAFYATSLVNIYVRNCQLRSGSLKAGMFDQSSSSSGSSYLFLDNYDLTVYTPAAVAAAWSRFIAADARLQYTLAGSVPTLAQYTASQANFFDVFPAGFFYKTLGGTGPFQPGWLSIALGGQLPLPLCGRALLKCSSL